ncbi:MAG: hypothetical protein WKF34_11440 [Pyrinomonadaceae bacterium]
MKLAALLFLAMMFLASQPSTAIAQRDYFTPEEIELIREAQEIHKRIDVLTIAIDRRFAALGLAVGAAVIKPKEAEKWGVLPKSSRFELLLDIKRILRKAVDDIDSLAERPDSAILPDPEDKKAKKPAELFPLAVRNLAAAARRYGPVLKAELDKDNAGSEKGSILDSLEMCDEIIAAVAKLPPEVKKSKN